MESEMGRGPKISVRNAAFSYDGVRSVWKDVNLDIPEGECFCLLGPNGCGKTTLFNCISGAFPLSRGQVVLNGRDVKEYSVSQLARILGIVYQEHSAPFPYTSLEVVRMGRTPYLGVMGTPSEKDTAHAYGIMRELGIGHLAEKSYTQISGGERQLVLIARTMCQEPEIILFDEPTSHLDFKNQAMVLRTVKKLSARGITIVMTSHFPNHVWNIGTSVAMMNYEGMVAAGAVDQVMTEENLTKTYGVPVRIHRAVSGGRETCFCDPDLG